jgi:RHS repeat-associated protein
LQTLATYTYTVDAVGNRTQILESTLISTNPVTTSHNSIASGAMAPNGSRGSVTAFSGGNAILAFTSSRRGNPAAWGTQTIAYSYDNLYRLTHATYSDSSYFAYDYDAVGNILTKTTCLGGTGCTPQVTSYAYDDANRLTSAGGVAYSWDNNGNLQADNSFVYSYNAANLLTEARPIHGVGFTASDYTYNGLGYLERSLVTVCIGTLCSYIPITNTLDLAGGLTQVLADGTNTYLYGNSRIAQYTGASAQYFLDDALGTVRQLADANGTVNLARSYEPYGSALSSVGVGTASYGFTGEWTDDPTGLVDLRARWYVPGQGRFLTKDTWAGSYNNPQTLDAWAYTNGNPTNYTDPSGRIVILPSPPCPSWWCNATWQRAELPGVAGSIIAGALVNYWQKACFFIGCHVDYDPTSGLFTLRGPTTAELQRASCYNLPIPAGIGMGPLEEMLPAGGGATQEEISAIESYLSRFGSNPENDAMLNRLRAGYWTEWEQRFVEHELIERDLVVNQGVDQVLAHQMTLAQQGIRYAAGFEAYLYHPDVILSDLKGYFSPAAQRLARLLSGQ